MTENYHTKKYFSFELWVIFLHDAMKNRKERETWEAGDPIESRDTSRKTRDTSTEKPGHFPYFS
jgi:hypothetical protein